MQDGEIPEVAGPRVERLVEMARLVAAKRGRPRGVEETLDPEDPDSELFANDGLPPRPHARLAGPTFEQWLEHHVAPQKARTNKTRPASSSRLLSR
jgi:hypothetical protein